ncbi:phage-related protein [Pullulanibacillus pueri]|uniref:WYL domain-containing protein n=1 Tax=Pullulanibacillus pueri TaxID=1437324 RepID=A0A8J3EN59_9BACL|nr:hypothetical protein [Pullulanibacillus pueri]MBM7681922.1 phage-related protein [Pullulanibacillus pueri]GGH83455.1 hypothetical protein GCM10007096_24350 [Pullulanibacillus pueri]
MSFDKSDIIEIIYMDFSGVISHRTIRVIKQKGTLLVAHCYTKKSIRTFYNDNILSWKLIKRAQIAS